MTLGFRFTDEQELFRKTVRDFGLAHIKPNIPLYEKSGRYPWDLLKRMSGAGLTGLRLPEEYGGQDADAVTTGIAVEELAKAGDALPLLGYVIGDVLMQSACPAVRSEWLPKLAGGDIVLGLASTEPHCGSDAAAMKATAARRGDEYILNGEKQCVSLAKEAAAFVVFAKTSVERGAKGISAFLLPMDTEGVSTYAFESMGPSYSSFGGFTMQDVKVPKSYLLGGENMGFYMLMGAFDWARVLIALACVGAASASLEESVEYVRERTAFGSPIAKFEAVQFRIAEDATLIEASRLLCYKALWLKDQDLPHTMESAMSKWWAPQVCFNAINNAIQNRGGLGYTKENRDELRLRFVRGMWIADGTADIMKIVVGREVLGKEYLPYR